MQMNRTAGWRRNDCFLGYRMSWKYQKEQSHAVDCLPRRSPGRTFFFCPPASTVSSWRKCRLDGAIFMKIQFLTPIRIEKERDFRHQTHDTTVFFFGACRLENTPCRGWLHCGSGLSSSRAAWSRFLHPRPFFDCAAALACAQPIFLGTWVTVLPFDCAARWLHLTPSGKVRERSPAEARTHASRVEEQNSMGEQWEQ